MSGFILLLLGITALVIWSIFRTSRRQSNSPTAIPIANALPITPEAPAAPEIDLDDPQLNMDFLHHLAQQAQENGNNFAADHLLQAAALLEQLGPHLSPEEHNSIVNNVAFQAALALNPQGAADMLADELKQLSESQRA